MNKRPNKSFDNIWHFVLYLGFAIGLVGIYFSKFDARRQFTVLLLMIAYYLIWGFVFHHLRRDATRWLMFEYLLIGLIGLLAGFLIFLL